MSAAGARVEVLPDPEALAARAADLFVRAAAEAVAARGRFAVALAGGSTPRRAYELLAGAAGVAWERVHVFFGDERCVPPDHPDSNHRMASQALLGRVPIPAAQVHRIRGEEADADAAAERYGTELRRALGPDGRLDLVLLGMGPDGHVASLFPGEAALGETARPARAVLAPKPPPRRITLTLPVLNAAREVILLVAGGEKAQRVAEVLAGRAPELPAARIRPPGGALWLLDAAAAAGLR